jgi:F0F1-type ATP synthase assembly protein I
MNSPYAMVALTLLGVIIGFLLNLGRERWVERRRTAATKKRTL